MGSAILMVLLITGLDYDTTGKLNHIDYQLVRTMNTNTMQECATAALQSNMVNPLQVGGYSTYCTLDIGDPINRALATHNIGSE